MFRNLLVVCAHVQLVANIQFMVDAAIRVEPARPSSGDGIELDLPIFRREFEVRFWRGAKELIVGTADVEHIGRGVGLAQRPVSSQGVGAVHGEGARGHYLVDIAGVNIAFKLVDVRPKPCIIHIGHRSDPFPLRRRGASGRRQ